MSLQRIISVLTNHLQQAGLLRKNPADWNEADEVKIITSLWNLRTDNEDLGMDIAQDIAEAWEEIEATIDPDRLIELFQHNDLRGLFFIPLIYVKSKNRVIYRWISDHLFADDDQQIYPYVLSEFQLMGFDGRMIGIAEKSDIDKEKIRLFELIEWRNDYATSFNPDTTNESEIHERAEYEAKCIAEYI